jgi:peroxiredoxin
LKIRYFVFMLIVNNIYIDLKKGLLLILLVCAFCFSIQASPAGLPAERNHNSVRIFGHAPEYAGSNIVFFKYSDRITFIRDSLFILEIDSEGKFDVVFNIDFITYVFAEYELYHAYFYAEPGQTYELILPPFDIKTEAEIFNPFFRPERIHIGIKDMKKTDLNFIINEFDYFYDRYYQLNYIDIISQGIESNLDTFISQNRKHFEFANNPYFKAYSKYRYAALRHIATDKKFPHVVVYANYTKDTVWFDNPAYMDLFNMIYDKYFDHYLGTKGGKALYAYINYGHSISNIRQMLSRHLELENQQLRELVILKGLNDAFQHNNFSWLPLLLTLDSLYISTNYDYHKDIAQNIADNTLSMMPGTIAPPFELEDTTGNSVSLASFRGHFLYLNFADTRTYSSKMEFDLINRIYERYNHVCRVVTILTDENKEDAKNFIRQNKLKWTFLFAEINNPVLSTYKVTAFPTYYLIDLDGTLLMSPAPGPTDNFERYLFRTLQHRGMLK